MFESKLFPYNERNKSHIWNVFNWKNPFAMVCYVVNSFAFAVHIVKREDF